jgi:hypothetical protein
VSRLPYDEGIPTNRGGYKEKIGRVGRVSASDGVLEVVLEYGAAERLNGDGEYVFPPLCATVRGMRACSDTVVY